MSTEIQIDAGFIRRVYRTSLVVWALVAMSVHAQWGWSATSGVTAGTALALASLRAWEWAIRAFVVPGSKRRSPGLLIGLGFLKMILLVALLTVVVITGQRLEANLLALTLGVAGGFLLVHLVILLKAIGIWLLQKGVALTPADRPRIR
jgi:hypothetical protein